jgi:hypothetical protein
MTRAEALSEFPTIFANKKTVDELDNWNRPKHLWHALAWIKDQRGMGKYTDEEIDDTTTQLEKRLGGVCAAIPFISGPCTLRPDYESDTRRVQYRDKEHGNEVGVARRDPVPGLEEAGGVRQGRA